MFLVGISVWIFFLSLFPLCLIEKVDYLLDCEISEHGSIAVQSGLMTHIRLILYFDIWILLMHFYHRLMVPCVWNQAIIHS